MLGEACFSLVRSAEKFYLVLSSFVSIKTAFVSSGTIRYNFFPDTSEPFSVCFIPLSLIIDPASLEQIHLVPPNRTLPFMHQFSSRTTLSALVPLRPCFLWYYQLCHVFHEKMAPYFIRCFRVIVFPCGSLDSPYVDSNI